MTRWWDSATPKYAGLEHGFDVDRLLDRLAHPDVGERRVVHVHAEPDAQDIAGRSTILASAGWSAFRSGCEDRLISV